MINLSDLLKNNKHARLQIFLLYGIVIFALVFTTGFVSDDFSEISNIKNKGNFFEFLPSKIFINIPVLYYTHYIFYYFLSIENFIFISLVKFLYTFLSFYMISRFFSIFIDYYNSLLISFLFIFWPTHDSTVYFFLAQYLMLTISFQLYAYYLLNQNFFKTSLLFSLLGSFISYGSTPVSIGLSILFILNKSYKKSLYIIIPNIIYIFYYFFVSKVFAISSISRIPNNFELLDLVKNFLFQIGTFLDVNIGVSFFIKIFFSIFENNFFSLILSLIFFILLFFFKKKISLSKIYLNNYLLLALILIILVSLLMFSITGGYYQNIFNLGNRVSIYSSLFFSYLFVYLLQKNKINFFFLIILIVAIFGISNHWKNIRLNQDNIIKNISSNQKIKNYDNNKTLFIVGNEYSYFGKFSHVEFFSASHVAESIFNIKNLNNLKIKTLNRSFLFDGKYLKDLKFTNRKFLISNEIVVYDSDKNTLFTISNKKLNNYLGSLRKNKRHWIQFVDNQLISYFIAKYIPKLNYLFN